LQGGFSLLYFAFVIQTIGNTVVCCKHLLHTLVRVTTLTDEAALQLGGNTRNFRNAIPFQSLKIPAAVVNSSSNCSKYFEDFGSCFSKEKVPPTVNEEHFQVLV